LLASTEVEVLSIQYVYELVFLIIRLCLKAGAKVQLFFSSASDRQKIFLFFSDRMPNVL